MVEEPSPHPPSMSVHISSFRWEYETVTNAAKIFRVHTAEYAAAIRIVGHLVGMADLLEGQTI